MLCQQCPIIDPPPVAAPKAVNPRASSGKCYICPTGFKKSTITFCNNPRCKKPYCADHKNKDKKKGKGYCENFRSK